MSREMTLANGRLVLRGAVVHGSVHVVDGLIADISVGAARPRGALDLDGDYLLPGLVELHTDVIERHAFPRPNVAWPPVAAVLAYDAELTAAGITTVLDSLAIGYVFDSGRRPREPRTRPGRPPCWPPTSRGTPQPPPSTPRPTSTPTSSVPCSPGWVAPAFGMSR